MTLHLHAIGHFHPEHEISNAFLESLDIGTSEEWILERVGIRSRRTALPLDYIRETRNANPAAAIEAADHTLAQMGARAAELALSRAGLSKQDIGMVVSGSCAPDTTTPAEACNVARELELELPCFDLNSACTSFFAGLHVLAMMRPEALPPYVLLVCPEGMTRTVDYRDRSTAVLWGDASVAAVVSATVPGRAQILATQLDSSPAGNTKVVVPRLGHFVQDGRNVQMFGVRKGTQMYTQLRERFAEEDRRLHFVGHQANLRMLEAICRRCEIDAQRHHFNVDRFGNTGGASGASVVSMRWDAWQEGDDLAMLGVGAGLSWASCLLRF
jgi:3-oxoacyl-[acyl-carrier-protein] synthase-3